MPPTDPTHRLYLTQEAINQKFTDEDWEGRLQNWALVTARREWDPEHPLRRAQRRVSETRHRYKDGDGNTRAFIIVYRHVDGTEERAVRMLREDNATQYDVEYG
jgi:hypothetical protein